MTTAGSGSGARTALPALSVRALLSLAVPSVLFAVLTNAYRSVDQYWIQWVSTEAQAAIGSSTFVLILFYGVFQMLAGGAAPLVARGVGANDRTLVRRVIGGSLTGVLLIATVTGVCGGLGAELIAEALGLTGETAQECSRYLRALSWTILPLVLTPVVDQVFISMGEARLPMVLHGLSLLLNIALTPLLIFHADLGIAGAALASNLSRAVSTGLGLWILLRRTRVRARHLREMKSLARVLKVGVPVGFGTVMYSLVYWGMLSTSISPLGPHVNAALGIGFSALEGFTWPCFYGLSLATASLVGRYLGAGQPELARRTVHLALPLAGAMGLLAAAAFALGGHYLTGLFTDDPLVHAEATVYASVLAWSQLLIALEALAEGTLQGAGATRIVFWLSTPLNIARIPLAWFLAFPMEMGPAGIWWAINCTTLLKTVCKGWVLARGRWVDVQI